ncbi:3'-5' exonuclease [Aliagarivorans taiwanensis]|uniref:3'-5' exonuclease n=1 Tax=Aliagarivorans taiwanensis TaxID=561966 RepID=UPI00041804DF|nr:3'-5' exonuclease [Aliagarivorans taiwanensis]
MGWILDTETTGLGADDEIVELGIIDAESGAVAFSSLIKPSGPIPESSTEIHGITGDDVAEAPIWSEVYPQVCELLNGASVFMYNADFDRRMIRQTCRRYELAEPEYQASCVMLRYARMWGERDESRGSYRWQKLAAAAAQQNIDISDLNTHRATDDCEITRRLLVKMNAFQITESPEVKAAQARAKRRAASQALRARVFDAIVPDGVALGPDNEVTDRAGNSYRYFVGGCPSDYTTVSKVPLRDINQYKFVGLCKSSFGELGYVVERL